MPKVEVGTTPNITPPEKILFRAAIGAVEPSDLQPPSRAIIVEERTPEYEQYNSFPGAAVLASGRIVVTYRSAYSHTVRGQIKTKYSDDNGNTWSDEQVLFKQLNDNDPETGNSAGDTHLRILDVGGTDKLVCIFWVAVPNASAVYESYITTSVDGITWTTPAEITEMATRVPCMAPLLFDNKWYVAGYQHVGSPAFDTTRPVIWWSNDLGDTWTMIYLTQSLTLDAQPDAGDYIQVGEKLYKWIASGTPADSQVLIGADLEESQANLVDALKANKVFTLTAQPVAGSVTRVGTVPDLYTWVTGAPEAGQVQIGALLADSQTNLDTALAAVVSNAGSNVFNDHFTCGDFADDVAMLTHNVGDETTLYEKDGRLYAITRHATVNRAYKLSVSDDGTNWSYSRITFPQTMPQGSGAKPIIGTSGDGIYYMFRRAAFTDPKGAMILQSTDLTDWSLAANLSGDPLYHDFNYHDWIVVRGMLCAVAAFGNESVNTCDVYFFRLSELLANPLTEDAGFGLFRASPFEAVKRNRMFRILLEDFCQSSVSGELSWFESGNASSTTTFAATTDARWGKLLNTGATDTEGVPNNDIRRTRALMPYRTNGIAGTKFMAVIGNHANTNNRSRWGIGWSRQTSDEVTVIAFGVNNDTASAPDFFSWMFYDASGVLFPVVTDIPWSPLSGKESLVLVVEMYAVNSWQIGTDARFVGSVYKLGQYGDVTHLGTHATDAVATINDIPRIFIQTTELVSKTLPILYTALEINVS